MLPLLARGPQLPEVRPPLRRGTVLDIPHILLVHRSEIQAPVGPLDDTGVYLLLSFSLAIETPAPELRNHVSAIDQSSGIGEVLHQMCGGRLLVPMHG